MSRRRRVFSGHVASFVAEVLEDRRLLAGDQTFAIVGDFSQSRGTADVAALVKNWNPSFVVTVGDNNYPDGAASTMDANVGQYYHQYIYPYKGTYGPGSADGANHFFPALGNHDWVAAGAKPYLDYFTLPGNERYYSIQQGNVGVFIVDSDPHEPDGTSSTSVQANWLKGAMASSTAKWKLVVFHHPAYSSGGMGSNTDMQWPFAEWGASAVVSGHDHDYERLSVGGLPYFVDGLGGESIVGFGATAPGSQVRYAGDYGAMRVTTSDTTAVFQFVTRTGQVIDTYTLGTVSVPAAPSSLNATVGAGSQVALTWADNSTDESGFEVERSADNGAFARVATTVAGATNYLDVGLETGKAYAYRVRAVNAAGASGYSNTAGVTIPAAQVTYLSDLAWDSATGGWGPVERDTSNAGQAAGDGRRITIAGATYAKGLGTHAFSQVVYTLGGKYSRFLSDVGVDDESFGNVDFQVFADGVQIYESGAIAKGTAARHVDVSVAGVNQLTLTVTDGGDGPDGDHADWAGARLTSPAASGVPAAPSGLTATPLSTTQINLSWVDNSTNESGFKVERSTDGVNFAQVGTTGPNVASYSDATVIGTGTYTYRVRATASAGDSGYSNTAASAPLARPAAPTGLTAAALSTTQVKLTWADNSASEAGFKIERSTSNVDFVQVGVADDDTTSYTDVSLAAGTTYYYRVRASNSAGDSAYSNVASAKTQTSAGIPWADSDVGIVRQAGSSSGSNGVYTVKGSGADIWDTSDGFHYAYRTLSGNGQIIARVTSVSNTDPWAKAGVMIRETLSASSKHAMVAVTPGNGIAFQRRTSTGGSSSHTGTSSSLKAPYWVRLIRSGNTFASYYSANGTTWTLLGSATISMGQKVYIGLAVTSHNASALATATFDNVSITGAVT
jgi:regulation of enolase protein 1 (concanavalin A-like superfamily)/fibronectin type 3 domain-containing protein